MRFELGRRLNLPEDACVSVSLCACISGRVKVQEIAFA